MSNKALKNPPFSDQSEMAYVYNYYYPHIDEGDKHGFKYAFDKNPNAGNGWIRDENRNRKLIFYTNKSAQVPDGAKLKPIYSYYKPDGVMGHTKYILGDSSRGPTGWTQGSVVGYLSDTPAKGLVPIYAYNFTYVGGFEYAEMYSYDDAEGGGWHKNGSGSRILGYAVPNDIDWDIKLVDYDFPESQDSFENKGDISKSIYAIELDLQDGSGAVTISPSAAVETSVTETYEFSFQRRFYVEATLSFGVDFKVFNSGTSLTLGTDLASTDTESHSVTKTMSFSIGAQSTGLKGQTGKWLVGGEVVTARNASLDFEAIFRVKAKRRGNPIHARELRDLWCAANPEYKPDDFLDSSNIPDEIEVKVLGKVSGDFVIKVVSVLTKKDTVARDFPGAKVVTEPAASLSKINRPGEDSHVLKVHDTST